VLTRYTYDPDTFRLARLRTERYTLDGLTYRPSGPALQDHAYDYDLAGNLLTVHDRTPACGVPNTPEGPDALDRRFGYDPVYRLVTATGREADQPSAGPPWLDTPRGSDPTLTRGYTETYTYDALGGVLRLAHAAGSGGFTRDHTVEAGSNRLVRTTVGGTPFDYAYDAVGNLTAETTSRHFDWNHADQLVAFGTQTPAAEPSLHAQYRYDVAGRRVTKLVRRQGGAVEVTHYVGGIEHHRFPGGENTLLDVMDDRSRIAVVRVGPAAPGDAGSAIQFHLGDHQGSSAFVVDGTGAVTNREEYTPPTARPASAASPASATASRQGARRGERARVPRGALLRVPPRAVDLPRPEGPRRRPQALPVLRGRSLREGRPQRPHIVLEPVRGRMRDRLGAGRAGGGDRGDGVRLRRHGGDGGAHRRDLCGRGGQLDVGLDRQPDRQGDGGLGWPAARGSVRRDRRDGREVGSPPASAWP
jgi:YD repeat-containing protein